MPLPSSMNEINNVEFSKQTKLASQNSNYTQNVGPLTKIEFEVNDPFEIGLMME